MKRLLLLLLWLPALAAAKVPDEVEIVDRTMDPQSPYYYTNLMMRYRAGDESLTAEDYHYLYYGYAYQDAYKPLDANPDLDRTLLLAAGLDAEHPEIEQLERMIEAANDALRRDPFNPQLLNLMAYAYGALGDQTRERAYYARMQGVLQAIEASGDGLTQKTPRHILMFSHALDLLTTHNLSHGKSRIVSRTTEYIPLLVPRKILDKKVKGYYFDFSRIYWNKPDSVTYKRDRTWQFNNLRPREYK